MLVEYIGGQDTEGKRMLRLKSLPQLKVGDIYEADPGWYGDLTVGHVPVYRLEGYGTFGFITHMFKELPPLTIEELIEEKPDIQLI